MNIIKVKDIEIRYDESQSHNIDSIKNIISNNYDIFLPVLGKIRVISLVPTDDDKMVYVDDFDKFFYEIVDKFFNNDSLLKNSDVLATLYIEYLIRNNSNNEMSLVQSDSNISDNLLYTIIAYIYFMKTSSFDDFINYLKGKKETKEILEWLQKEARFTAYNYLLDTTVNYLKQNDFDYINNISSITNIMVSQLINNILSFKPENEIRLPSLNIQELDSLFNEFLEYINAPESWKNIYKELKSNGKIIFKEQTDELDESMCFRDDDDVLRIVISSDGTIKSFIRFVHEFMHYIPMQDSINLTQFSILELPSIFFEKVAAQFLKTKGYNEDAVDEVMRDRIKNNIEIYTSISSLFYDISAYVASGPILKEQKVLFWENNFKVIKEAKEKVAKLIEEQGEQVDSDFLEMPKIDISMQVDMECDQLNDSFIQNGLLVINGYQYLLDTYLAQELLKKLNDDNSIIPRMINVTNNLNSKNLKDILIDFDIKGIMDESKENSYTLTKQS